MLHCGETGRGVSEAGTQHGGGGHAQTKRGGACLRPGSQSHTRRGAALTFTAKHLKAKEREPGQSRGLSGAGKSFRDAPF